MWILPLALKRLYYRYFHCSAFIQPTNILNNTFLFFSTIVYTESQLSLSSMMMMMMMMIHYSSSLLSPTNTPERKSNTLSHYLQQPPFFPSFFPALEIFTVSAFSVLYSRDPASSFLRFTTASARVMKASSTFWLV